MTVKYYSQSGEDALIWEIFQGKTNGFFIEIGAFDGRHLSNSLSFEEQGWSGICVEPTEKYFELCIANRPNSICVQAACVGPNADNEIEFLTEPLGLLSGITADQTANMEGRYASRGLKFPGFERIVVPAKTIDQILRETSLESQPIDFISIDTEGTELDILQGCSPNPRLIICEANTRLSKDKLTAYLSGRGYQMAAAIGSNLFFARSGSDVKKLRTATFDITTELTYHPMGQSATHPVHATRRVVFP